MSTEITYRPGPLLRNGIAIVFGILILIFLGFGLFSMRTSGYAGIMSAVLFSMMIGGFGWYYDRKARKMSLTISDAGFDKTAYRGSTFVPWEEIKFLQIDRNKRGKIRRIVIQTASKRLYMIAGLQEMDDIAKQVEARASSHLPLVGLDNFAFKIIKSWIPLVVFVAGIGLIVYAPHNHIHVDIGRALILLSFIPTVFIFRNNLASKQLWIWLGKRYLLTLGLWILIAIILLVIFNYIVH